MQLDILSKIKLSSQQFYYEKRTLTFILDALAFQCMGKTASTFALRLYFLTQKLCM